jgi:hypothetical protein
MTIFKNYLDNEIAALEDAPPTPIAWDAISEDAINLTATTGALEMHGGISSTIAAYIGGDVEVTASVSGQVEIQAPGPGGSIVLTAETVTLTQVDLDIQATDFDVEVTDDVTITATGADSSILVQSPISGIAIRAGVDGGSGSIEITAGEIGGLMPANINLSARGAGSSIGINAPALSFFGIAANPQPTGVAVTVEAIHAALVSLGLITGP